ncbi:MAG: signal recognition particle-docking protein FtsY [Bacteroidales bacterium]|jgi:fused signal recognition particle receptor|nr:signal recognition particle-docking protein FtsY [Bacteroidales bacterium]
MSIFSVFNKEKKKENLDKGLAKTKENLFTRLSRAVLGKSTVDEDVLDALEEALITSDVGVSTTLKIIDRINTRISKDKYLGTKELNLILRDEITEMLTQTNVEDLPPFSLPQNATKPYVILVVGVNGVGKTTTIGKLAHQYKSNGYSVLLGAADTFRAAAVEQLEIWAQRVDVPIVTQSMGADPAAVAFDTVKSAIAKQTDIAIIDTAGRLHNRINLMNELSKIKNVLKKQIPDAPHEILLVLDATTGQNAIEQAKQFSAATDINALAVTKLDGTAKGGVVIGISDEFQIPVKYIGIGEQMADLQMFNRREFIDTLFSDDVAKQ